MVTHDCFKVPYQFKDRLNKIIHEEYINFYNSNYLEKHFMGSSFLSAINTYKINMNIYPFRSEEISGEKLCGY